MTRRFGSAIALIALAAGAAAQTSQFAFEPSKVPIGTAFHYHKANLDGSRATRVSIYVVDRERIESLKWDEDGAHATLVQARMDWRRWSVSKLDSWRLRKGAPPELRGTLEASADGREIKISSAHSPVQIDRWPWHSYDFDFASLGATLPHLRNPEADVIFWRTDFVFADDGVEFAQIGGVRLHFEALDLRDERELRRYSIGGAGLTHFYGKLWTDANTGWLIEYEIPVGDGSRYKDVRLWLTGSEQMTQEQWGAYKKARIGEL